MTQPPPPDKANGNPAEGGVTPHEGPTGLTYREQQRRRIVIAGLTTPALMTLPSRRAWSAACSKSKLKKLSGNLSAKKKVEANCDNIACKHTFWKDPSKWPMTPVMGAPGPGDSFESIFPAPFGYPSMYEDSPSIVQVLDGKGKIRKEDNQGNKTAYDPVESKLKKLNKAAAAALLNAYYLNNMNFIIGFWYPGTNMVINPSDVMNDYYSYLEPSLSSGDDSSIKAGKDLFEGWNDQPGGCPLK